jgi:thymidylate synthase (FAD)
MSEITLTSEITVKLVDSMGGDLSIVRAARVSTAGAKAVADPERESPEAQAGLIDFLMKMRHGSAFEHSTLSFFVHAPAFVWWEWVRHRVGMSIECPELSFNLESGRYRQLEPVFWVPRRERPMVVPSDGFKPTRPSFDLASEGIYNAAMIAIEHAARSGWASYQAMLAIGMANEVARTALGFGIYYSGYVTANPRSLMHFVSLRTHNPQAKYVSYPQSEIAEAGAVTERFLAEGWPLTHAAFVKHGRVAP